MRQEGRSQAGAIDGTGAWHDWGLPPDTYACPSRAPRWDGLLWVRRRFDLGTHPWGEKVGPIPTEGASGFQRAHRRNEDAFDHDQTG
jgi:hypothetical protein